MMFNKFTTTRNQVTHRTHLNIAKGLFGDEVDGDGEEIVGVASDGELH